MDREDMNSFTISKQDLQEKLLEMKRLIDQQKDLHQKLTAKNRLSPQRPFSINGPFREVSDKVEPVTQTIATDQRSGSLIALEEEKQTLKQERSTSRKRLTPIILPNKAASPIRKPQNEASLTLKQANDKQIREKQLERTIDQLEEKLSQSQRRIQELTDSHSERLHKQKIDYQSILCEIKDLRLSVKFQRDLVESKDLEIQQLKKKNASLDAENTDLLNKSEQLQTQMRNRQLEQCNMQTQVESLTGTIRKQSQELKEIQRELDTERGQRKEIIAKAEEENKRKYEQLKSMVMQYKAQMSEYMNITQQNYQILGDITTIPQIGEVNKQIVQHDAPIQLKQEKIQTLKSGSEVKVQKQAGRKHYSSMHRNQLDRVKDIFEGNKENQAVNHCTPKKTVLQDDEGAVISEYKRTICISAERQMSQSKIKSAEDDTHKKSSPLFHKVRPQSALMKDQNLLLPSYQKMNKNNEEVQSLELQLLTLSQLRDTLFAEYDRIPAGRVKTLKAKQRQEVLEIDITKTSSEIAKLKQRLRDFGVYNRE